MKRFGKSTAVILCAILCSCAGNNVTAKPETEGGNDITALAAVTTGQVTAVTEKDETIVIGEPLESGMLDQFAVGMSDASTLAEDYGANEFLESLGDPIFKEFYCKGWATIRCLSTDNIDTAPIMENHEPAYIKENLSQYFESGYTFGSFYNAFTDVFTEELTDRLLEEYPFFRSYNGELWTEGVSFTGDISIVHREFELLESTDDEMTFQSVDYHVGIGDDLFYDPEKKDSYSVSNSVFIFVKTDKGWRISECPPIVYGN